MLGPATLACRSSTTVDVAPGGLDAARGRGIGARRSTWPPKCPLRAWLFERRSRRAACCCVVLHHIAADGWSTAPLAGTSSAAYAARRAGRAPELGAAAGAVRGLRALAARAAGRRRTTRTASWRGSSPTGARRWPALPAELPLPFDRPRPAVAIHRGAPVPSRSRPHVHAAAGGAGARHEAPPCSWCCRPRWRRCCPQLGAGTDIPLGAAVAGRTDAALDDLVGFFVNTLVLRTDLSGDPAFRELLRRVRETDLAAFGTPGRAVRAAGGGSSTPSRSRPGTRSSRRC